MNPDEQLCRYKIAWVKVPPSQPDGSVRFEVQGTRWLWKDGVLYLFAVPSHPVPVAMFAHVHLAMVFATGMDCAWTCRELRFTAGK